MLRRSLDPGFASRVPVHEGRLRAPLPLVLAVWAARRAGRLAVWAVRHPRAVLLAAAVVALEQLVAVVGPQLLEISAAALAGGLLAWRLAHRSSFARRVGRPARSAWRRVWVYRREWQPAMVTAGLALGPRLPRLCRVRATRELDVVTVRMLPGQTLTDWSKAGERLAQTFGVAACRPVAIPGRVQLVELRCLTGRDPLAAPVPVQVPGVDLEAIPCATDEAGRVVRLPVLYSHVLVAGETGAGKGSVLWSLLAGLAPAIGAGVVEVRAIDPKGGMELAAGAPLFRRFSYSGAEHAAKTLDQAVADMQARAGRLRGVTRKHRPTVAEPLVVVVVDELAALLAYVTDPALRRRLTAAVSLLLSQGRAVGFSVIAATQDARKDTLTLRDLFPTRVALRAAEAEQADMVLGRGSRDRGALTDRIPEDLPGVGYVVQDGRPDPVRVRFSHVTDEAIAELVDAHRPPAQVTP